MFQPKKVAILPAKILERRPVYNFAMAAPLPKMLEMFRRLVAIPSVSSLDPRFDQSNRAVAESLAEWLQDLGFSIEIAPLPDNPGKVNLIATLGQGENGLVLSGHTDTVPYDERAWATDPFTLTERDGRLYGLGSADMKCFFPLVIEAVLRVGAGAPRRPLVVLATADEESSMAGARALVSSGRRLGRHALIGEPTGLKPVCRHKGVFQAAIHVTGRAGHASNPAFGNNAIEGMHRVIGALLAWRTELQAQFHNPLFEVSGPTLNLGNIHGGDSPNRICAECELQIDMRTLPEMPFEALQSALRDKVGEALAGTGLRFDVRPLFSGGVPPLDTAKTARIVRTAEELTGADAGTVGFATEGPFFNALGMETVVLGPGDIAVAHQPDEYVALERLAPMIDLLEKLIVRCCMRETEC
jgi:acetylornithine deacetylase